MGGLERVYTTREVAEIEGISSASVSNACAAGRFPGAYRTGTVKGAWRIPESAIAAYREAQSAASQPASQAPAYGVAPYRPQDRRGQRLRRSA